MKTDEVCNRPSTPSAPQILGFPMVVLFQSAFPCFHKYFVFHNGLITSNFPIITVPALFERMVFRA